MSKSQLLQIKSWEKLRNFKLSRQVFSITNEYSNNKKPLLEGKAFRKKFKRETTFRRKYVIGEVNTILDCGRAFKRTMDEGKIFAKFAIKSVPASIKFVLKMIIK
jgi:hypothetical protein